MSFQNLNLKSMLIYWLGWELEKRTRYNSVSHLEVKLSGKKDSKSNNFYVELAASVSFTVRPWRLFFLSWIQKIIFKRKMPLLLQGGRRVLRNFTTGLDIDLEVPRMDCSDHEDVISAKHRCSTTTRS